MTEMTSPDAAERLLARAERGDLRAIAGKVMAGERLSLEDGLTLYRSDDLHSPTWLAGCRTGSLPPARSGMC